MTLLKTKQLTLKIGNQTICHHLDLEIRPHEVWGILGPNGSGKTTLLHALAGLYAIQQGEILLNNQYINKLSVKTIAQSIGILFQHLMHTPIPQTVFEYCLGGRYPHLAYFKKESAQDKQIAHRALESVELDRFAHRTTNKLSGGEKRRLAIATLLAQTPSIYLLDEPTNHLDIRHQIKVLEHFHLLACTQSSAVVMATHDVNLAEQFCNRILLLYPQDKTLQGTPATILTADRLTRLYQHPMRYFVHGTHRYWHPEAMASKIYSGISSKDLLCQSTS